MEPSSYVAFERTRDGRPVRLRALRPTDKQALLDLFERLSSDTIYYRFLGVKTRLTRQELVYLTELDFHRKAALVAVLARDGGERIVGVARYACPPHGPLDRAEIALTVEDAEQGRGIGTLLLDHLMRVARAEGIRLFDAYLLSDNVRTIRLLERSGLVVGKSAECGLCHLVVSTAADSSPPSDSPGESASSANTE
jgi:RimJ/RimL family protein N-acetyltransferase